MDPEILDHQLIRLREALPVLDAKEIEALTEALPMARVDIINAPQTGLIMAKSRDCFDTDFFLGELLVTRAEVTYEGQNGQATLLGDCPDITLIAAVLEALYLKGETHMFEAAHTICRPAFKRLTAQQAQDAQVVSATRVEFHSMSEEA